MRSLIIHINLTNMKTIFTLLLSFALTQMTFLTAQIDQVSVGATYAQQAFYDIQSGDVTNYDNDQWDLAFSAVGQQDAGIFINESVGSGQGLFQIFESTTTDWSETITNTDAYVDEGGLFNAEDDWSNGALNTIKDPASPFDYGWGAYNTSSNQVEGTTIFIIKNRAGEFLKFRVVSLISGTYTFETANLDNSNPKTYSVSKDDAGDGQLVYFSLDTESQVEITTDYDLFFGRYFTPIDAGDGTTINYPVTGILLGPGVEAAVADGVDVNAVVADDYADLYSTNPETIGHDWKSFSFTSGWVISTDRAQFVKTRNGEIYKIVLIDFEGSSTGVTTLEKTLITSVSVDDQVARDLSLVVYPNPTTDFISIKHDEQKEFNLTVYNDQGQTMIQNKINSNTPMSVDELTSGLYLVLIENSDVKNFQTLIVK